MSVSVDIRRVDPTPAQALAWLRLWQMLLATKNNDASKAATSLASRGTTG